MIEGRPVVFISHSEATKARVAGPFKEFVDSLGLYGVLVGDQALPDPGTADPRAKVAYFLDRAQMFVALATPDDRTESGEVHTRPNIILELGGALDRPHLAARVQVFKAAEVKLPSNINPVHEPLDPDRVEEAFPIFERQARTWGLLPSRPTATAPAEPAAPEQSVPEPETDPTGTGEGTAALVDLAALLGGDEREDPGALAARAHLAASAALAARRSSEPLGVHELNGLYRDRAGVTPDAGELRHLLKTVIANVGAANAPGWYWLRDLGASEVRARIAALAAGDGETKVVKEAIALLASSPTPPKPGELRTIVESALGAKEDEATAALGLLARHGTRRDLTALAGALDSHSDAEGVATARLTIRSREVPAAALRTLIESPALLGEAIEANLLAAAKSLPAIRLREALASPADGLRALALRALNASSRLRKADIEAIIDADPAGSLRFLAADLAVGRHWDIGEERFKRATEKAGWLHDRNALGVRFVGLRSASQLQEELEWHRADGAWIYEALGRLHPQFIEDRIETDLDEDFAALKDADLHNYVDAVRTRIGGELEKRGGGQLDTEAQAQLQKAVETAIEKYEESWTDDLEAFVLGRFRLAALRSLVAHPAPRHSRFGRRFLTDSDRETSSLAVEILASCGGAEDVPQLVARCNSALGELRVEAAKAALALAEDPRAVAFDLLAVEDAAVLDVTLPHLAEGELEREEFEATWALLDNESFSIRESVTRYLLARHDRRRLAAFLNVYPKGRYFYSVVARIDRELYAPGWVRRSARSILGG